MFKKLIGLIIVLVTIGYISSGQSIPRQFQTDIAKAKTDSQLLKVYAKINEHYQHANNDSLKTILEDGVRTFDNHGFIYGKATLLIMLSGIYEEQGFPAKAMASETEGLKLFTTLNDQKDIANANNTLGVSEMIRGNYNVALAHFLAALSYYEKSADTGGMIASYVRIGAANNYNNNNDKALEYYQKALVLALHKKTNGNTLYIYNNIGICFAKKINLIRP